MKSTFRWPTLGDKVKAWEGVCDKCGREFPADTLILGILGEKIFFISCACSPRNWIKMEGS